MQNKFSEKQVSEKPWHSAHTSYKTTEFFEIWKTKLNMGHKAGVIYMDLSKVVDSLNHELLITKLRCYGLDHYSVEFFRSYLLNRYQCCKINNIPLEIGQKI